MMASQVTMADFSHYLPKARSLVRQNISTIRRLPMVFAALLLREVRGYDWRFPAERRVIDSQFAWLRSLSPMELRQHLSGFADISLGTKLMRDDWIRNPQAFLNDLTKYLWATHQFDRLRRAGDKYAQAWRAARPESEPAMPRLSIVVFGKGVCAQGYPLFSKLRQHGTFFPEIDASNAWSVLRQAVETRAAQHPERYQHWYIDGGSPVSFREGRIAQISWSGTADIRRAVLRRIHDDVESGHGGPESLRTELADTTPEDLGLRRRANDEVMKRFRVEVLTMGAGTQIFSTTFVLWSAREALRRAQPCTLLLRYAPRQRYLPMNELLSNSSLHNQVDSKGSLMDADIGAYYTWIDQQRLTGRRDAAFLAWSEDLGQAVAVVA